ncbi:hypothetical protein DET50_13224 [Marinobacter pelagius]|uniref:Uncharacterized protein n=1 Tax=Marinobacter pelagius TaxID=379482 RepID=A0A366G0R5_9GAMM|nr:hypothetical protein [Marinobacter pelagius]RBP20543.1 hypothetical protein DET50_13224 [Marinobacter pelagius]
MSYWLVPFTQAGLFALLLLLGVQMFRLSRAGALIEGIGDEPIRTSGNNREQAGKTSNSRYRTELFTQLHILAALQERECRNQGFDRPEMATILGSCTTAWLYGAGCALCDESDRHSKTLAGLVAHIVSRKTGIDRVEALSVIEELTASGVHLACFRGGLDGARHWREHNHVPGQSGLCELVAGHTFI